MKAIPTDEEREQVAMLLKKATEDDRLTEWEAEEFLPSLQAQSLWSQKQRDILDGIWIKIFGD